MKNLFPKKKKPSGDMSLQITSMADIFMILLVFLLKSYSTSISQIAPVRGTKLPVAEATGGASDQLALEIASDAILIDQKPILKLNQFRIPAGSIPEHGESGVLHKLLMEQRKKIPNPNLDPELVILADHRTPYATIRTVLASAAHSGYVNLKLAVVQNQ